MQGQETLDPSGPNSALLPGVSRSLREGGRPPPVEVLVLKAGLVEAWAVGSLEIR
jgi:hypothetical protein